MRLKIDQCYKCLCNSCSRFYCQYRNRCNVCNNNNMKYVFDCDYFESKHTKPQRYRIKRYTGSKTDVLNTKLDFIIEQLGLTPPNIDYYGTYDVICKDTIIARFSTYKQAEKYKERIQNGFSTQLKIIKRSIDI